MATPKLAAVPAHGPQDATGEGPASDRAAQVGPIGKVDHADAVRVASVALAASGWSQQRAATDVLEISPRIFEMKLDPQGDRPLSLKHTAQLCQAVPGFGQAVGTWLISLSPAAKPTAPRAPEAHVMRLSAALGDVAERIDEATSDGSLTREERRAIARDLQSLIERAQAALRDLGDG